MSRNIKLKIIWTIGIAILLIVPSSYAIIKLGTDDSGQGWFGDDTGLITCSNGRAYEQTAANLQAAIYSFNGTLGGWVDGGMNNISLSSTLYLTDNVELRNIRLFLADNANCTMIENAGQIGWERTSSTRGNIAYNYNIKLTNVILDGNCYNQPTWVYNNNPFKMPDGIFMVKSMNFAISNCKFMNITHACINADLCNGSMIRDSRFYNWGGRYLQNGATTGTGKGYGSAGMWISQSFNTSVSGCFFDTGWSGAVIMETFFPSDTSQDTGDFIVSNCIAQNCHFGFYCEDARDGSFSDCIARNISRALIDTSVQAPWGFLASSTENIKFSGCNAYYCGNDSDNTGGSFFGESNNGSFINCNSYHSYASGFQFGKHNFRIEGCGSFNDSGTGIYCDGDVLNPSVIGNTVIDSGSVGIYVGSTYTTTNRNAVISNNIVNTSDNYGIYCAINNYSITGNCVNNIVIGSNMIGIIAYWSDFGVINNNKVTRCTNYGICFSGGADNSTVSNNFISYCTNGIKTSGGAVPSSNITISFNRIMSCNVGIVENTNNDWNIIFGNNCLGCTTNLTVVGANTWNYYNR